MKDAPALTYGGGVAGLSATIVGGSSKSRTAARTASVERYAAYIKQQADVTITRALRAAEAAKLIRHYYYHALAGFAAGPLTHKQVEALRSDSNVLSVTADSIGRPRTVSVQQFVGLDGPGGAWSAVGGSSNAGQGIVIGIVDSGYDPELPSFSDRADPNSNSGAVVYSPPPVHFTGICQPGENFTAGTCK
eukprot:gene5765-6005_t